MLTAIGSQLSITDIKIKSKKKKKHKKNEISSTSSSSDQTVTNVSVKTTGESDRIQSVKSKNLETLQKSVSFHEFAVPSKDEEEKTTTKKTLVPSKDEKEKIAVRNKDEREKSTSEKYESRGKEEGKKELEKVIKKTGDKTLIRESSSETTESLSSNDLTSEGKEKDDRGGGSSTDYQQEKIIVVESSESAQEFGIEKMDQKGREADGAPKSVVTLEQFYKLVARVEKLQRTYNIKNYDLVQQMLGLQKKLSMTDPMALIQLSARLEQAERNLENMTTLLIELANRTPSELKAVKSVETSVMPSISPETIPPAPVPLPSLATPQPPPPPPSTPPPASTSPRQKLFTPSLNENAKEAKNLSRDSLSFQSSMAIYRESTDFDLQNIATTSVDDVPNLKREKGKVMKDSDFIDMDNLLGELQEFYDDMFMETDPKMRKISKIANAIKILAKQMSQEISDILEMEVIVDGLEDIVSLFAEKVNNMDSEFSSLMTGFQENLSSMQYDLEVALDNLAESLSNQTGDPEAVADMNSKLSILAMDLNRTLRLQKELSAAQKQLGADLNSIWLQLKVLNQTKCNRDEVTEKLKEKAGIEELNGIMTVTHLEAVRGDFQKRIIQAYDKFNATETIWQKVIDDLIRILNFKSDVKQTDFVTADIKFNVDMLQRRIDYFMEIAGPEQKYNEHREILRNQTCISCHLPARDILSMPELKALPPVKTTPDKIGFKKGDADNTGLRDDEIVCYPNAPIRHPIDPRGKICSKICGGKLPKHPDLSLSLSPSKMMIFGTRLDKEEIPAQVFKKPCIPCKPPPSLFIIKELVQHKCIKGCQPSRETCDCGLHQTTGDNIQSDPKNDCQKAL
ncbi:uncharacterized protein LOC113236651 [Hyposmocoma kahamanoa]|uniref:uncharacterized protein LOC113236651 n=1 Tax=Hyposmocoma kahamanoa TaxID=1477025 RepID=UPI000E6D90D4|nr:uncharacterized protein LOC113236651 [Hyposmocoma kahamanoa]